MPRIQLSALLTDIKGKSNGSVFSKNSGGNYFRTNPSGTQRAKSANNKMTSLLPPIAQSWKSLSMEERDSWNDAGINFPTLNSFGVTRIPTGYQLFMKLNSVLAGMSLPQIKLPPSPPVFPALEFTGLTDPELFQLMPTKGVQLYSATPAGLNNYIALGTVSSSQRIFSPKTITIRVLPQPRGENNYLNMGGNEIWSLADGTTDKITLTFLDLSSTHQGFSLNVVLDSAYSTFHFNIPIATYMEGVTITVIPSAVDFATFQVFVNGALVALTLAGSAVYANPSVTLTATLGNVTSSETFPIVFSDFRYYKTELDADQVTNVASGYVLDTELIQLDFIGLNDAKYKNYGSSGAANDGVISGNLLPVVYNVPSRQNLIPLFYAEITGDASASFDLQIYASAPRSIAKTVTSNLVRSIAVLPMPGTSVILLTPYYKVFNSYWAPGSGAGVQLRLVSTSTGAVTTLAAPKKPCRCPHFKAGADMQGKVN